MEPSGEKLAPGTNFCSIVTRKVISFRKRKRVAICKTPRSAWERKLLQNEIQFYHKLIRLFNVINKLHFAGDKFCPTFFEGVTTPAEESRLVIEDLQRYRTLENIQLSELCQVLRKLSIFHAIGFKLKTYYPKRRFSQRKQDTSAWCTWIHGDCWARNIMFRDRKHVKFIDFGFSRYGHCLVDLIYLLYTSTQTIAVREACEYYREHLNANLRKLDLDLDFSSFNAELVKTATGLFPLATRVIKTIKTGPAKHRQLEYAHFVLHHFQNALRERESTLHSSQNQIRRAEQGQRPRIPLEG